MAGWGGRREGAGRPGGRLALADWEVDELLSMRRRVARNIRENYIRGGMGYRTASGYNVALAVGMVPEILVDDIELWDRLADLIEPCCDREALLALADEMDSHPRCRDDDRCGRQMPPPTIHDHARRIREACGEAVA